MYLYSNTSQFLLHRKNASRKLYGRCNTRIFLNCKKLLLKRLFKKNQQFIAQCSTVKKWKISLRQTKVLGIIHLCPRSDIRLWNGILSCLYALHGCMWSIWCHMAPCLGEREGGSFGNSSITNLVRGSWTVVDVTTLAADVQAHESWKCLHSRPHKSIPGRFCFQDKVWTILKVILWENMFFIKRNTYVVSKH